MVYTGTIDAESKAYVRFLREEGDLTVQEIVDLCGISRASIYRCLNAKKCEKDRQLRGRPRLISPRDERLLSYEILQGSAKRKEIFHVTNYEPNQDCIMFLCGPLIEH